MKQLFEWGRSWWITWRVWRGADAEQRAILRGLCDKEMFDESNFVEAERPRRPYCDE